MTFYKKKKNCQEVHLNKLVCFLILKSFNTILTKRKFNENNKVNFFDLSKNPLVSYLVYFFN